MLVSKMKTSIIAVILSLFILFLRPVHCTRKNRELSLISPRMLMDNLEASSDLKKIFVDIETDLISAISPVSLSGINYPWLIFSPSFAQAQSRALEQNSRMRRRYDPYSQDQELLSSNLANIHFYLYQDRSNPTRFIDVDLNTKPTSQNILPVHPSNEVKILIHGYNSSPNLTFAQETKNAYLEETNHTVIVVDWEVLSLPKTGITLLLYPAVTTNAFKVGGKVAQLIEYLLENKIVRDLSRIHIVGHSLGAHAAGYAGDLIKSRYGKKIGRITALDAALLAFIGPNVKLRLDKSDAKFVDAIHTSSLGVYDPVAHVDFYPNGGRNQASCYNPATYRANVQNTELSRTFEQIIQSCSHARAYHLFAKSIRKNQTYWGCKCSTWRDYRLHCKDSCVHAAIFGEYVSPAARGKYFLEMEP